MGRNMGTQRCFAKISRTKIGNKLRSICCNFCVTWATSEVKFCLMLKIKHLSLHHCCFIWVNFSHWPLTWHLAVNSHNCIYSLTFISRICYVILWLSQAPLSESSATGTGTSGLATLLALLLIIVPSGCFPATTCTSVFDDAFKLSSW